MKLTMYISIGLAMLLAAPTAASAQHRLKELVSIEGVRENSLVGFGIVVGLAGTGDDARSPVVQKSLANLLNRLGVRIDPAEIKAKNVAAVVVTAELPAFARAGMNIDVTVSSMGAAKSLQGGTLVVTPLKGPDRAVYALAQGALSLGGFAVEGASGSTARKNHATVARIPAGAVIERGAPTVLPRDRVTLLLKQPDFTTASRIATAIDATFSAPLSMVTDPGSVVVQIRPEWKSRAVHFIATLEAIEAVADAPAKVIIDERTGTIVVGANVRLSAAAIAHGALTVRINEQQVPSQPNPLADGQTVVTEQSEIEINEQGGDLRAIRAAASVGEVAAALNQLGAKPRDLVAIFQALHAAGALRADIEVL